MNHLTRFLKILKNEVSILNEHYKRIENEWGRLWFIDCVSSIKIETYETFVYADLKYIEESNDERLPIHFKNFLVEFGCFHFTAEVKNHFFSIKTQNPNNNPQDFRRFLETTLDENNPDYFFMRPHYSDYRILMEIGESWASDFSGGIVYNVKKVTSDPNSRALFFYKNDDLWIPVLDEEYENENVQNPVKAYPDDIFEMTVIRELKRYYEFAFIDLSDQGFKYTKAIEEEFKYYLDEVKDSKINIDIEVYKTLLKILETLKNIDYLFWQFFKGISLTH
ncbi:hypothetical protein [uncultured Psychroserpens sp.]|uniref:hypothetical protein n=1 Tax=uncultured Psychroserpens sp. TaxID=255436 RepID=UPI00262C0A2C|nr:hypothetical protein [uncultured Psychroserpens sp.]